MTGDTGDRAWRFRHPDLDDGREYPGLGVSLSGGIAMVDRDASVRQSILILLSTAPGERVMRPYFGCSLNRLVFAPNDDTTAGMAIHYVRQALERWEPRIAILRLDANRHPEDPADRLGIQLEYRIRASQRIGHLEFDISLTGVPE
jgi:phage baseplate assembly protein W